MKRRLQLALGAVVLACSSYALAQSTIYRLQQPDGKTVYSDKKLPQSKVQKELTSNEGNIAAPLVTSAEERDTNDRLNSRLARRDELWRARNRAQSELDAARSAKANGEEPFPGERIGTTSRRSRLNENYWARQDALQRNIDGAQRNLERAEQNLREAGN